MDDMPFSWGLWLCRSAQTSAAALLAGTAILQLLAAGTHPGPAWQVWRRLAWACGAALFVAGTLQLGLTAAEMSGRPPLAALASGTTGEVLKHTHFGAVWRVRMGLLGAWGVLALTAAASHRSRRRARAALDVGQTLLAAAWLVSLVWVGHAQASAKSAWLLPVDCLHVLAAGAWPGGLPPLAALLARAGDDPALVPAAVTITRRYSCLSVAAVAFLVMSGLFDAGGLVGTFTALWPAAYGRLLLCKAAIVVGMVGLGAMNRRLVRQEEFSHGPETVRRLWRNVAWECGLAVCVVLATEALAMQPPPA